MAMVFVIARGIATAILVLRGQHVKCPVLVVQWTVDQPPIPIVSILLQFLLITFLILPLFSQVTKHSSVLCTSSSLLSCLLWLPFACSCITAVIIRSLPVASWPRICMYQHPTNMVYLLALVPIHLLLQHPTIANRSIHPLHLL